MIDSEIEGDLKKRKRSELSSTSDLDTSTTTNQSSPATTTDKPSKKDKNKSKQEKKKVKKGRKGEEDKNDTTPIEQFLKTIEENKKTSPKPKPKVDLPTAQKHEMETIQQQLKELNDKVLTKEDPGLKNLIKQCFSEMKEELLKSVYHKLDVLESLVLNEQKKNDKMQTQIDYLRQTINNKDDEIKQLKTDKRKSEEIVNEKLNDLEQYGRRNTIRIDGVAVEEDTEDKETYESYATTMETVVETVNKCDNVEITIADIDIAHRVGKKKSGKQQIIAKLKSRATKYHILNNKKSLKGTGIFINEDLTKVNQLALACVRKKCPDEVKGAWSHNGKIKYKNSVGNIHTLRYSEFQTWFDMPWPVPVPVSAPE